ncbi:M50 family metallopeptidase [Cryptosporangium japonicum]|uniref:Integral membrane protein n=1 Tax=Cryptosporangium japonicum TaxID=80872 RepID=A0ABN0ULT9_9ACTN
MLLSVVAVTPSPGPSAPGRIEQITEQIATRQPTPTWLALLTGLVALLFAGTALAARLGASSHEGMHAFTGGLVGKVDGVRIPRKGPSGTTVQAKGPSKFTATFVGYLGPSFFGLLGAWLLSRDHPVAVLWLAIVSFGVLFWLMQNFYGGLLAVAFGGALLLIAWNANVLAQTAVAYFLVWSLLLFGSRDVAPSLAAAARKIDPKAKTKSEYLQLREMTYVPQIVWVLVHLVLCWVALAFGAWLLLVA